VTMMVTVRTQTDRLATRMLALTNAATNKLLEAHALHITRPMLVIDTLVCTRSLDTADAIEVLRNLHVGQKHQVKQKLQRTHVEEMTTRAESSSESESESDKEAKHNSHSSEKCESYRQWRRHLSSTTSIKPSS